MKNKEPKKGSVKQINPKVESTPEKKSEQRIKAVKDAIFEAIGKTSQEIQKDSGDLKVSEVLSVLSELTYSYNSRNLKSEVQGDMNEFNNTKNT